MLSRAAGTVLAIAACLAAITGCGSSGFTSNTSLSVTPAREVPSLLAGDFIPPGPIVSMSGAVVSADGCIAFKDSATGTTAPLLWPRGTTVDPAANLSVVLLNGSVAVDAPLALRAAHIQAKDLPPGIEGVPECAPDPEQAVVVVSTLPNILMQQ